MPSPFPGIDPYLENPVYWGGVHAKLIAAISDTLNLMLPEGYFAEIDEHVWLQAEEPDDNQVLGKPDAFVTGQNGTVGPRGGGVAIDEPTTQVTLPMRRRKAQKYVTIVGPDGAAVVSVVEVLRPSNKNAGPGRDKYLAKREEYFATGTGLVEIDLLRDGERMPLGKPSTSGADYYVFVCRGGQYPKAAVWSFTVREPSPTIPVPLKATDPDAPIDLQRLVTELYDRNRYAGRINYTVPPAPPLRPSDAAWAAELLKKPAKRKKL